MPKDTSTLTHLEGKMLSHNAETTLEHVLNIMPELIRWLIRSGVGYTEFSAALKILFFNEAIKELDTIQQKKTDSAISLLSGLHRRDVRQFCELGEEYSLLQNQDLSLPLSVPSRVISLWISQDLPYDIPIQGDHNSFEYLVKQISSEKRPKSILQELIRLGIVEEENGFVHLQTSSFTPNPVMDESKQLFTQNIAAHLAAGVHNLTSDSNFLEQAIFADELSEESIEKLKHLSTELWNVMSKAIVATAMEYCKEDKNLIKSGKQFRLGIYQYD